MARIVRLFLRTTRLKTLLWLIVSGMLLAKTKQIIFEFSSFPKPAAFDKEYPVADDITHYLVSLPNCSRYDRLGIPEYVTKTCREEDRLTCLNFTCDRLLTGDESLLYQRAREFMQNNTRKKVEPQDFVRMTKDCDKFLIERGFARKIMLEESEEDFPIAFNILAHGNVEQVERLIHALYRQRNSFCVHFDLKSVAGSQEALEAISQCLPNVFSASKRINIYWGSFNRLEAEVQCMRDHLESGKDWKYLLNAAGQTFPIRSYKEMVQILKIYNGANDIEGMHGDRVLRHRFEYKFEVNKEGIIVMKEPHELHPGPPHELDIVRGSAYGIFSRKFVEFMLTDQKAKDFLEWSRDTFSPDELYFSTFHHTYSNPHIHPPGGYSGEPDEKLWLAAYANWGENPCSGYQRHGICVFGVEDLPRIINRKEFFVNKFLVDFEPMALDCLRAWIDYKDSCTGLELLDTDFYKALPFILKK